ILRNVYFANKHNKKGLKKIQANIFKTLSTCTEAKEVLIKPKVIKYKILKSASPKSDRLTHNIHP
ncbi:hypothetical protein DBR06_SOUSAS4110026, partial [Sousa chinensis]